MQEYIEKLRIYILGNPIQMDSNTTIPQYFFDILIENNRFMVLMLIIFLIIIINLLIIVATMNKSKSNYYLVISGIFLVTSGLIYRYSHMVLSFDSLGRNHIISNESDKAMDNSLLSDSNIDSIKNSTQVRLFSNLIDMKGRLNSSVYSKIINRNKKRRKEPEKEDTKPDVIETEKIGTIHKEVMDLEDNEKKPQKTNKTKNSAQVIKKIDIGTKEIKPVEIKIDSDHKKESEDNSLKDHDETKEISSKSINPIKKEDTNKSKSESMNPVKEEVDKSKSEVKPPLKKEMDKSKLENNLEFDDDENNIYMRKIIKNLQNENDENELIKEKVNSIDFNSNRLKKLIKKFTYNFDEFYEESMKIERELMTFNVFMVNYDVEAKNLENDVNVGIKIGDVLNKLTKNSSDGKIDKLLGIKHKTNKNNENDVQIDNESNSMAFLTIYFCFQVGLFLYFFVAITCGFQYSFILRVLLFLCLTGNLIFGIYMMLYAQMLDKICVVGNIKGCRSTFTNGFAEFAATTNLDLKTVNKSQKDKMYGEINKIQTETEKITKEISNYLEFGPIQRIKMKIIVFSNLFDNISFVNKDFEELTDHKVNKKKYFEYINEMRNSLENIALTLESQIPSKEIIEIYSREIAFLAFIKSEKENIYRQVNKQILRSQMLGIETTEKYCWTQKKKVCEYKVMSDYLFIVLLLCAGILFPLISI